MKAIIALIVLTSSFGYGQIDSDILVKSGETIKQLKSIKYTVTERNRHENISADIIVTRDKPYPLFGISKIKVTGISLSDHGSEQIQFASNGNSFQYYDVANSKVIQMDEPTDRKLFRTSISKYLLVPFTAYQNDEPFESILKQLKVIRVAGDTIIFGEPATKVHVEIEPRNFDGTPMRLSSSWYFRKSDYLVIGHVSSGTSRFLRIKELNQEYPDKTFSLRDTSLLQRISGNEPKFDGLLPVGSLAPDFTLISPTLGKFSLHKNRGKVILLDFWGTWCVPCIKAMPEIQKINDHFIGRDVIVIGVSVEPEEATRPDQFMIKKGFTYPILLGGTSITNSYKVVIFPTVYLIDKSGMVLHAEYGSGREGFTAEVIDMISKAIEN
jgi:peroxiredoxin